LLSFNTLLHGAVGSYLLKSSFYQNYLELNKTSYNSKEKSYTKHSKE